MATTPTVVQGYELPSVGESISARSVILPAGTTKILVVAGNTRYNPPRTITGVVWNTTEAFAGPNPVQANAAAPPSFTRAEGWQLDNPTIGTFNVVVTWDGAARGAFFVIGLSDAAAGAFFATAGLPTSAALAVASAAGGAVFSCYFIDDGDGTTIALTPGPTPLYNAIGSAGAGGTSGRMGVAWQAGTGSPVAHTWTPTGAGAQPSHIAISIAPAGSSAAGRLVAGALRGALVGGLLAR